MTTKLRGTAPDGSPIIGTYDLIPGTAHTLAFYRDKETGALTWEWKGETDVDWDGQETQTDPANNDTLFVAEDGSIHCESDCTFTPLETEDAT